MKLLADFGAGTVGVEIVKQGPGADLILSRHQMAMEVTGGIQAAVEGVKGAVKHIAGAIGIGTVKSQGKAVGFGAELEDGRQGGAVWNSQL